MWNDYADRLWYRNLVSFGAIIILALLFAACRGGEGAPAATTVPATVIVIALPTATPHPPTATPTDTATPTATHAPSATATHTPMATATHSPTATHTPTSSPTATATSTSTPTPLDSLSIEAMRMGAYPGSEVTLAQTLEPGDNYARYLASYESEGNTIYALLTIPYGDPPADGWPVIIFNHGYIPASQYRTTERYVAYVDALARNGYVVFKPDFRGHGDSEGEPSSAYSSPDYTVDVLNATAAMQGYPGVDPTRVGMWGHSMGGHITLRVMVTTDDVKAGVIWAGVVASYPDMISNWSRPNRPTPVATYPGRRRWTELNEMYGTPDENPAFWASVSPITYAADVSGPIQLHHGTADEEVPLLFSERLYEELLAAGREVEFYVYEGDNHNISASFSTAMSRTIQFFDTYLK